MKVFVNFQNKQIPVFADNLNKKTLKLLRAALDKKVETGRNALQKCLQTLISIEVVGCEAILHSFNERDSLALSLY
ncbi:3-dehydroquinate dehydratase [Paenibacillus validus]|uniref:3-dehydroquinate dehydratase n=1 Tax=Paenibacillus validus TaxID=44253 RepID=A0A7X2ZDF8_9BACL|nr:MULTISPECIES: 3-dehydroquinate dehydratase [Paenibacillus]MED4602064.1 3-dehydroquinate dehydratase [Paenibacillus validus]MED4607572.1 3-dehydroquinate dehydratase [Paenibacillus validus]MUG72203.1 3-dehydroquinate dehydratase [Paenibacillus validus]